MAAICCDMFHEGYQLRTLAQIEYAMMRGVR
jgi:hypothetical protein